MRILRINKKIIYPELSYKICGLLFAVHKSLGRYRSEKQYMDAFEKLLIAEGVNYIREKPLPPSFDGEKNRRNIPDFIIEDKIIIDFKNKDFITKDDYFQMQRYLKSYNKKLGLIVNFRQKHLYPKRVLNPTNNS
jgi:GxxExxY protein